MRSLGYAECYSYSLLSQKALTRMGFDANVCMKLSNPLADFELLRASLLPGLLLAVENNLTRCDELRLFEAGSVFQRSASTGTDLPHEPAMLGLIVVNCPTAKSSLWKEGESALQAAKTAVSDLLTFLSVPDVSWVQDASQLPASVDQTWLHPGRSVAVLSGQTVIGWLGELHPQKTAFLDLRDRKICYAELDLSLIDQHRTVRQFHRFSSYPSIELDLSFLIAKTAAASEVEQVIREAGGELLTAVKVLDVFEKPEFGEDKKSMTWRMIYQSMERTLLDTEAAAAHENVIRALKTVYSIQVR